MNLHRPFLHSLLLPAFVFGTLGGTAFAVDPGWWTARGVLSGTPDDYAKVNLGQLKNMAAKARLELNDPLVGFPNGAGAAIDSLVNGWANTAAADDYAICNLGQLKAVAYLYWKRLNDERWATGYPWATTTTPGYDDYSSANLGQLKRVFLFGGVVSDSDGDGLPDAWEVQYAGSLTVLSGGSHDADGDGLTDAQEYALRTNPSNIDTDGDNIIDGDEVTLGWDPKTSALADATKTETFTYDAANRLTAVTGKSTLGYTPDANSNLTQAN